jgi:hypothetical protein
MELQKHKPLTGRTFDIQLVPVDDEFKKQFPKYKGKDRYTVTPVEENDTKASEDSEKKTAEEIQSGQAVEDETVSDDE